MSKLVWDQTGQKKFESGTKKGVLFVQNTDGTYENGVAWNGLTAITESPSGAEETALWADDIKYASLRSAEEFGGTIEAYMYPDAWCLCNGEAELVAGSGIVIGQQARKSFGLAYQTAIGNDTAGFDHGYKLHLIYGASVSPSERAYQTINDSPDAITLSWEFTTTPVSVEGFKPTSIVTIDSTKVPAATLALIEEKIFGSASEDSKLLTPAEIMAIVGAGGETGVVVTPSAATVGVGETFRLQAVTVPSGVEVTWTSSATDKATVSSSGVVTGKASGSATITATITVDSTDYTDTCSVTVSAS